MLRTSIFQVLWTFHHIEIKVSQIGPLKTFKCDVFHVRLLEKKLYQTLVTFWLTCHMMVTLWQQFWRTFENWSLRGFNRDWKRIFENYHLWKHELVDKASWERWWKMSENPLVLKLWSNALKFHMSLVCTSRSVICVSYT
jgi:hypothetical protein